jgi:hypothetical protein
VPDLAKIDFRWSCTVYDDTCSRPAICLVDKALGHQLGDPALAVGEAVGIDHQGRHLGGAGSL